MNHIKILILATLGAFLVSGLMSQESDTISSDTLFTLAFLGYIWYVLRRNASMGKPGNAPAANQGVQGGDPEEEMPAPPQPPRQPYTVGQSLKVFTSGRIIHHKPPWTIVEKGKSVGYFHHVPIPAWIRTSDNRQADYAGIAQTSPPEECVCVELPDQAELILPPGLIYAIRS